MRGHVEVLPEGERDAFALAVAEETAATDGPLLADYVRLNMIARKSTLPRRGQGTIITSFKDRRR
ncbi:MAG: hypothetical protein ACRDSJ_17940 [Rubrobacteraceae bacterium]